MKLKLLITLFLVFSFGVTGWFETDLMLQKLWYALMVFNLGLMYKWVFWHHMRGKAVIDIDITTANKVREEARN